jgi:hypothetical protein
MALINCKECKGSVSDQAASCPHCGYPVKKAETRIFETSQRGSHLFGQAELETLLRDGWVIIDKNVVRDGYSGDGEEVNQLTYILQKRG